MIELDLKRRRLAWPGASCGGLPSSMAERPSRIWFHVACLQRSREGISRKGISCRAVRLSVRHLSGLIYDGVDDFVRGPNVTGPTKRNHSSRCECASDLRRHRRIVLSVNFLAKLSRQVFSPSFRTKLSHQVRKQPHCRRSLSPAEFGKCGIDAFIRRDPRGSDPSH
jgi:hypothetical protein